MKGKEIVKALSSVFDACGTIIDGGACNACPLKYSCLNDTTFTEICDLIPMGAFDEMLGLAEDIEYKCNEDDASDYWDMKRKADLEERMIDIGWGY